MNRGSGLLVPVAVLAMLGGIALFLWPILSRETLAISAVLPRTTAPGDVRSIDDAILRALEERGFRAGGVRLCYADLEAGLSFTPASRINMLPLPAPQNGVPLADLYLLSLPPVLAVEEDRRCARPNPKETAQAAEWVSLAKVRSVYMLGPDDYCDEVSKFLAIYVGDHDCHCQFFLPRLRIPYLLVVGTERVAAGQPVSPGVISRAARWKTDLVCLDLPGAAGGAVHDLRKAGYKGLILVSARSVDEKFPADAGPAANGVRVILRLYPAPTPPGSRHPLAPFAYELTRRTLESWEQADVRNSAEAQAVPPQVLEEPPAVYVFRDGSFRREHALKQ